MFLSLFETLYNMDLWFGFMRLSSKLFLQQTFLDYLVGASWENRIRPFRHKVSGNAGGVGQAVFCSTEHLRGNDRAKKEICQVQYEHVQRDQIPQNPFSGDQRCPLHGSVTTAISLSSWRTVRVLSGKENVRDS